MATREVKLPNGKTYTGVPEDVSDAQAWEKYQEKYPDTLNENKDEYQSGSAPVVVSKTEVDEVPLSLKGPTYEKDPNYLRNVKIDVGRIFADTKADLANLTKYGVTQLGEAVGAISSEQKEILQSPEMSSFVKKKAAEPIARVINEDVRSLYDPETGNIHTMDTGIGMAAEFGTYLVGGVKVFKNLPDLLASSKTWRNNFLKSTATGIIVDQGLTDPDQSISNVVETALGEEAAKEWENFLFLATDQDDTESLKRLKLMGEGATIGALVDVIGGANSFRKFIKNKFNKTPDRLTKEDKGTALVTFFKEKKEVVKGNEGWKENYSDRSDNILEEASSIRNLKEDSNLRYSETPEGEAQIKMQQGSGLNRIFNTLFTSRGYWTPRAFDAFNDSKYAQRATVNEAEVISRNLNKLINNLSDQDPDVLKRVSKAFTEKLDSPSNSFLNQIENIAKNYDLPEELASQVLEGRNFLDQLSDRLAKSSMVDGDLKTIIEDNMGSYIRRSFRLFEDPIYKPSDEVKDEAIDFIAKRYMNEGELPDLARQKAKLDVNAILDKGDNVGLDYIANVQKLNNNIFKGKEDIPVAIRKLMGEIENADESFLISAQKMSKFSEDSRFYDNLLRLGENKYIFRVAKSPASDNLPDTQVVPSVESKVTITKDSNEVIFDTDVYNTPISGTGSQLDFAKNNQYEYYTTPEIAASLKQEQGTISFNVKGSMLGNFVDGTARNFLSFKGFSQKAKTVYSLPTQSRNILGGLQFGPANGINPFGKGAVQTFKSLKNQTSQSDEALNEVYQEYQRLGIINTNATINEFRALLDSGMDADQNILVTVNDKLRGYGLPKDKVKAVTDVTDDWVAKPAEAFYLGVDDYFKVVNYNSELSTLQKAFPDTDLETLKIEAARKIRATLPNYDFVPPGIKALRYMPFGSFVSFPAEIVRTSANIYREAFKEMASGNSQLQKRGAKRFAGRTATAGMWYGAQEALSKLYGFTTEQLDAIQTADETPWSTVSPRLPFIMDDKIYTIDTQFLNSYETVNAPFELLYEEVQNAKLRGDDLDKAIVKATFTALGDLISPYVDQPIFTQALSDVGYALMSSDGRTPRGKELFNQGTPFEDKLQQGIYHVFESFVPTGINIQNLLESDAMLEVPNRNTGKVKPTNLELIATFMGIRATELDPEVSFGYRVSEFNGKNNDVKRLSFNYQNTPEEIVEDYINIEKARYRNAQDFYRQFLATKELIGLGKTLMVLEERGVSKDVMSSLVSGKYYNPQQPLTDINIVNLFKKTPFDKDSKLNSVGKLSTALMNEYTKMLNTNLYFNKEEKENTPKEDEPIDLKLAKGGEVYNVPQAPVEPDERIDKMTGLPYDQQAGDAFTDQEDRVFRYPFAGGGLKSKVKSALATLIGRGTKQQLETFIEAVNFNNELVDKGVLGENKQLKFAEWELEKNDEGSFVPKKNEQGRSVPKRFLTEEEVRKFDRNDISLGISGDEEAFNAIQHALLGYDNAYFRTPLIQGREIFSAKNQIVGGRDPNSEHTDRFNNRMGITANREGLSRDQFKSRIENRLGPEGTNLRFKNKIPIERGYDLVTNINDVPPDFISKAMDYITKPELKQDRVERNQGGRILKSLQRNY